MAEDMDLLHKLWLDLTNRGLGHKLHHRDVVSIALRKLEAMLSPRPEPGIWFRIEGLLKKRSKI